MTSLLGEAEWLPTDVLTAIDTGWKLTVLGEVLQRSARAGVPVIVLKGAALTRWLYALHERPMTDVDLLIRPRDFRHFFMALDLPIPAVPHGPTWLVPSVPTQEYSSVYCGVALDVHLSLHPWWLTKVSAPDTASLWRRAEPCLIGGQPALRLCPEDGLLHLAVHTVRSDVSCLPGHVEDIRRLVASVALDWRLLVRLALAQRIRTYTWVVLARPELAGLVPGWVLQQLRPSRPRRAMLPVAARLWQEGASIVAPALLGDRVTGISAIFGSILLPSRTWLSLRYPSVLPPALRLPWHWLRLLGYGARRGGEWPRIVSSAFCGATSA